MPAIFFLPRRRGKPFSPSFLFFPAPLIPPADHPFCRCDRSIRAPSRTIPKPDQRAPKSNPAISPLDRPIPKPRPLIPATSRRIPESSRLIPVTDRPPRKPDRPIPAPNRSIPSPYLATCRRCRADLQRKHLIAPLGGLCVHAERKVKVPALAWGRSASKGTISGRVSASRLDFARSATTAIA